MPLNDSVERSEARIEQEQHRIKALKAIREKGFEFDPAGFDYASFQVVDSTMDKVVGYVYAFKNPEATAGWIWLTVHGDVRSGHWNELIAEITEGTLYPYAAMSGRATLTNFVHG